MAKKKTPRQKARKQKPMTWSSMDAAIKAEARKQGKEYAKHLTMLEAGLRPGQPANTGDESFKEAFREIRQTIDAHNAGKEISGDDLREMLEFFDWEVQHCLGAQRLRGKGKVQVLPNAPHFDGESAEFDAWANTGFAPKEAPLTVLEELAIVLGQIARKAGIQKPGALMEYPRLVLGGPELRKILTGHSRMSAGNAGDVIGSLHIEADVRKGQGPNDGITIERAWKKYYVSSGHLRRLVAEGKPMRGHKMSVAARAVAALTDHPDATHKEIADIVGCHPGTVKRCRLYMSARELLKRGEPDLPRGSKTRDGDIEAWEG